MAYGMQVLNTDGRIVFDTDDPLANFSAGTATTLTGYYQTLPTISTGQLLLLRPTDNTTAVISTEDGRTRTLGSDSDIQTFAQASGVKYRIMEQNKALTPATSGYGIETYDGSGNVLFSSESSALPEILAYGEVGDSEVFMFDSPGNIAFNDIYVVAPSLIKSTIFSSPVFRGSWAYFDDTNEQISFTSRSFSVGTSWDPFYTGSDSGFEVRSPFIIVGVRS